MLVRAGTVSVSSPEVKISAFGLRIAQRTVTCASSMLSLATFKRIDFSKTKCSRFMFASTFIMPCSSQEIISGAKNRLA